MEFHVAGEPLLNAPNNISSFLSVLTLLVLEGGTSLSVQDSFGTYTFGTCFLGTASFGTLNVNIGTVTFGTYKISVQSTSVHKCQFWYKCLQNKTTNEPISVGAL